MIIIHDNVIGISKNLGNKLFIYFVARTFAELRGDTLVIPSKMLVQRNNEIYNLSLKPHIGNNIIYDDNIVVTDAMMVSDNYMGVINNSKNKNIILTDFYTKYDYIRPYKSYLKKYYSHLISNVAEEGSACIMLRDSKVDNRFAINDINFYLDSLNSLEFNKLYISYDHYERHENMITLLKKIYNVELLDLPILELFYKLTSCEKIIASQGSFSFWVCLLSNANEIIWPVTLVGPNNISDPNVNFLVDDDSRYHNKNI